MDHSYISNDTTVQQADVMYRFSSDQMKLLCAKRIELEADFKSKTSRPEENWNKVIEQLGWQNLYDWKKVKKRWENCVNSFKKFQENSISDKKKQKLIAKPYFNVLKPYLEPEQAIIPQVFILTRSEPIQTVNCITTVNEPITNGPRIIYEKAPEPGSSKETQVATTVINPVADSDDIEEINIDESEDKRESGKSPRPSKMEKIFCDFIKEYKERSRKLESETKRIGDALEKLVTVISQQNTKSKVRSTAAGGSGDQENSTPANKKIHHIEVDPEVNRYTKTYSRSKKTT